MTKVKEKLENVVAVLKEHHFWMNAVGISLGLGLAIPFGIKAYQSFANIPSNIFPNIPPNIAVGIGMGIVSLAGAGLAAVGVREDAYLIKNIEGIKKAPWDYYLYR